MKLGTLAKKLGLVVHDSRRERRTFLPPADTGEFGFCLFDGGIVGVWIIGETVIFYTSRCNFVFEKDVKVLNASSIPALAKQFDADVWKFLEFV